MILDAQGQYANKWAPTLVQANLSTNVVDHLPGSPPSGAFIDLGMGASIGFYLRVDQTVTSGGAATVDFAWLGNLTDPTFASGNLTLWDSGAIGKATLTAGYEYKIKAPRGSAIRYSVLQITIGTAALTAGQFSAWVLNDDFQDNKTSPAGFSLAG